MHEIQYLQFPYKKSRKTILKECRKIADMNGDYSNQISGINFKEMDFFRSEEDAYNWIGKHDTMYYNVAVPFKGRHGKHLWLVKIEYHC